MPDHPNKHIREVIEYAVSRGWRVQKSSARAHIWGQLFCPLSTREGCIIRVFSTPKNPENHAKRIRTEIERCPHFDEEDD